jgi:asparagine synthase (glutamine-hydrolysing)
VFSREAELTECAPGAAFFRVRKEEGRIATEGAPCCRFGHVQQAQPGTGADPFASWDWDGKRLTVRNDRYGFHPLFYYCRKDEFAVSPSLVKLLEIGAPREIDGEALGVLLRVEYLVGEDTPFQGIRAVPPDARMFWEDGRLEVQGGYLIGRAQSLSREAAMDGYIELFRAAVRRRAAQGPAAVALSGGRDSRHIFLELCDSGCPPEAAVTVRPEPHVLTQDVEAASRLTALAGVRHHVVDAPRVTFEAEWQKNIATHLSTMEHSWIAAMVEYIRGRFGTLYEGVGGDVLSTGFANTPQRQAWFERGEYENLADSMLPRQEYPLPQALPARIYRQASRDAARARLAAELRRHAETANPLGSFLFWNRARRIAALSPTCLLGSAAKVWCPYLDADLFDFLITLPSTVLLDEEYHRFHTDVIHRAYPKYVKVPFAYKKAQRRRAPPPRRLLGQLARLVLAGPRPVLLRRSYMLPRLVKGAMDPAYTPALPDLARLCLYLLQVGHYSQAR